MTTSIVRRIGRGVLYLLAAFGLFGIVANAIWVAGGISAIPRPSSIEVRLARATRHCLIPAAARRTPNPVEATPDVLASARAHFADHCAVCHGNDGKAATAIGSRLSPRPPDLSAAPTQRLSDGELYWIIENGVKLTGMPGFAADDPAEAHESWELVHFVRHLPRITEEELGEMERLNPTLSRAEVEKKLEIEKLPAGAAPSAEKHHH